MADFTLYTQGISAGQSSVLCAPMETDNQVALDTAGGTGDDPVGYTVANFSGYARETNKFTLSKVNDDVDKSIAFLYESASFIHNGGGTDNTVQQAYMLNTGGTDVIARGGALKVMDTFAEAYFAKFRITLRGL